MNADPHKAGAPQTTASSSSPPLALLRSGPTASRFRRCPERGVGRRKRTFQGQQVHTAWLGLKQPMQRACHGVFAFVTCLALLGPAVDLQRRLASLPFFSPGRQDYYQK